MLLENNENMLEGYVEQQKESRRFEKWNNGYGQDAFNSNVFFERLKSEVPTDQLDLANVLHEAVLIHDGVLSLYDSRFHRDDFLCFINEYCTYCSVQI